MPPAVRMLLLCVFAGISPALAMLAKLEPGMAWITAMVTPMVAAIVGYLQANPAQQKTIEAQKKLIDSIPPPKGDA